MIIIIVIIIIMKLFIARPTASCNSQASQSVKMELNTKGVLKWM